MSNDFEPGDTVELKSGGPRMTVSEILDDGKVFCEWFDGEEPKGRAFPPEALKEWTPPSIGQSVRVALKGQNGRERRQQRRLLDRPLIAAVMTSQLIGDSEPSVEVEDVMEYGVDSTHARIIVSHLNQNWESLRALRNPLDSLNSENGSFAAGQVVSFRGIVRLPEPALDSVARLRLRMAEVLSDRECA